MSKKQISCLDGVPFALHEHFRNIQLLPKPQELYHKYDVSDVLSLDYDDTDELIFVGKCKAKKDILLKKQEEEFLAQQHFKLQQLQLWQQQQLQQQMQQSSQQQNQNLQYPKIQNSQIPQTTNDINAQTPAIATKPFNSSNYYIHQTTTTTTSSKTTAVTTSIANVTPMSTNLNSHVNEILIPAPVNSTSNVQQYSKNSQNPGFPKQNRQLKIDLKDFESEQDPFENLSLKVINDIEELDKVFHGTNSLATKTTALTTLSATSILTTTTTSLATTVYKPTPTYTNDLLQNQQHLLLQNQQQQQLSHLQQQQNFYEIPKFTQKSLSPLTINNNNHPTIDFTSSTTTSSSSFYSNNNYPYIQQKPNIIDNNNIIPSNPNISFYNSQLQQQHPIYNNNINDFKHYNSSHNPFSNQPDKLYSHYNNTFTNQNIASGSNITNVLNTNVSIICNNDINNKNAVYYNDIKKIMTTNASNNINNIDDFGSSILDKYFYNKYVANKSNFLINQQPIALTTSPITSHPSTNTLRQAKSTSDLTKLNNDDSYYRSNYNDSTNKNNDDGGDYRFTNFPKIVPSGINVRSGQISDVHVGFEKQNSSAQHFYGRFTPPIMKISEKTSLAATALKNPHSHISSPSHVGNVKMIKSKPKSNKEELIDRIILMGFSEDKVHRAVSHFGLDESKIVNHLCMLSDLKSQIQSSYNEKLIQDVLFLKPEYTIKQIKSYLEVFRNFQSMGFPAEKIHQALKITETDQEMILDILTSTKD